MPGTWEQVGSYWSAGDVAGGLPLESRGRRGGGGGTRWVPPTGVPGTWAVDASDSRLMGHSSLPRALDVSPDAFPDQADSATMRPDRPPRHRKDAS